MLQLKEQSTALFSCFAPLSGMAGPSKQWHCCLLSSPRKRAASRTSVPGHFDLTGDGAPSKIERNSYQLQDYPFTMENFQAFNQNAQTSMVEARAAMELNKQALALNTEAAHLVAAFEAAERIECRIADLRAAGASDGAIATDDAPLFPSEHVDSEETARRRRTSDEILDMVGRILREPTCDQGEDEMSESDEDVQ